MLVLKKEIVFFIELKSCHCLKVKCVVLKDKSLSLKSVTNNKKLLFQIHVQPIGTVHEYFKLNILRRLVEICDDCKLS